MRTKNGFINSMTIIYANANSLWVANNSHNKIIKRNKKKERGSYDRIQKAV